ncbi:MAG: hypothetical protein MJE68_21130 [Proteobacteria bacterium]|nr:hypothetical protein [Pseudomonadota bacterium]
MEDCGHVLEVKGLDQWMDQVNENEEIKWKRCPQCSIPVLKTVRYSDIIKQILQDMNKVKTREQNFLSAHDRKEMREELAAVSLTKLEEKGFISRRTSIHRDQWGDLVRGFSDFVLQKAYTTLLSAYDILKTEQNLLKLVCQLPSRLSSKPLSVLLSQAKDFLNWIKGYKHRDMLTDQMTIDVNAERRRILLLEASLETQLTFIMCKTKIDDDDKQLLTEIHLMRLMAKKFQNSLTIQNIQG